MSLAMCLSTKYSSAARFVISSVLVVCVLDLLTVPALAQMEFSPSAVKKGVLLVASPLMDDQNFHQTVLLVIEHGKGGTVGLILNRPTDVLVSEALRDLIILKGTLHRLFTGGPVEPTRLILLFRLKGIRPDTRQIVDNVYIGTPTVLERMMIQPQSTETFRAFSGFAGWAPGQLEQEMRDGFWGLLPSDTGSIFDHDPTTLWQESVARLQAPRTISH